MALSTLNLSGLLQSRQCPSDMTNGGFDAFCYVSLGSEVMHLKIAPHPFTQRSSGELMHSWASRGDFSALRMFRIGNGSKKDAVEGMNVLAHGLGKMVGLMHRSTRLETA